MHILLVSRVKSVATNIYKTHYKSNNCNNVLLQPRGNVLLVGIGGSGRQSLSRIGSHMCDLSTYQVAITTHYRLPEFREDLKTLYSMVGVENKPTSFLFNDTQVVEEQFLEIVNNMLSTGEVANLYKSDEMEDVSRLIRFASPSFHVHLNIIRDVTLYRSRST